MSSKTVKKTKNVRTIKNRISFITNGNGKRTSVVLPIKKYEKLLEDLHDLAIVAERKNEKSMKLNDFLEDLRKDGLL